MLTLILSCFLLIILPILYNHYHRCPPYSPKRPATPTTSPPTFTTTHISSYTPPTREDLTSNIDGGDDDEAPDFIPSKKAATGIAGRKMSRNSTGIERKPWDPPFPRTPQTQESKNIWLTYLHPLQSCADPAPQARAASLPPSTQPITANFPKHSLSGYSSNRTSVLKIATFAMGVILFIFAFAILIAHCLAWFIVYKTEARLGELHKGVLRGGDMRVCLCAS